MTKLKKKAIKLFSICLVLIMFLSITPAVFAAEHTPATPVSPASDEGGAVPYIDEQTWVTRKYNGMIQMRLWSNTRGIWLTDWITVGYY